MAYGTCVACVACMWLRMYCMWLHTYYIWLCITVCVVRVGADGPVCRDMRECC